MENNENSQILFSYLKNYKFKISIVIITLIISCLLELVGVYFIGYALDKNILSNNIKDLARVSTINFFIFLISALLYWFDNYSLIDISGKITNAIKINLFKKMENLSLDFFESSSKSKITLTFTKDIESIHKTLAYHVLDICKSIILFIASMIFMIFINYKLAMITISITVALLLLLYIIFKSRKDFIASREKDLKVLNSFIIDDLLNLKSIKAYGLEKEKILTFHNLNKELHKSNTNYYFLKGLAFPLTHWVITLIIISLSITGGLLIFGGKSSIGEIFICILLAILYIHQINKAYSYYLNFRLLKNSLIRINELNNTIPSIKDKDDSKTITNINGLIEFENVSLKDRTSYDELKEINLKINKGEKVVLFGDSSSGKYAFCDLIDRFYEPSLGKIKIDNNYIDDIKIASLRSRIGYIIKNASLFSGTIKENIAYGKLDGTENDIILACKTANIHDYILSLKEGYDTEITPTTTLFSDNQKMLLLIARTIVGNPDIIIIEEERAKTDIISEKSIKNTIDNITNNKTSIIIANNINTIKTASRVLFFHQGKILGDGKHNDLLLNSPIYSKVFRENFNTN